MLDGVPRPLPGDAEVFSDLAEGEVIVVILAQHLALFGREHFAVKIEQIAISKSFAMFCPALTSAVCKGFLLYIRSIADGVPLVKDFLRHFAKFSPDFSLFCPSPA